MSDRVQIELQPLGKTIEVERGRPLQDILFAHGVEFPCGGRARCRGCKVKVLKGELPLTPDQERRLTDAEIKDGWRLACQCAAVGDLTLEMAQWEATILADDSPFAFVPREGLGIAVDLGTTTLVAQLIDLSTGYVLGVRAALNDQARHGADIMSRVNVALQESGRQRLQELIRSQIGQLVGELISAAAQPPERLRDVVIVGNTVMHHLFCGITVEPLSHYPFETSDDGLKVFAASTVGWDDFPQTPVRFLPCLGGFVGSDILAGILATRLHKNPRLSILIDLGTNGEIVVGNADRMVCASTAAGPAFEGARISTGMRAATGAIVAVHLENGQLQCKVIGQNEPRGICGSGLVDAAAVGLDLGVILPNGRLANNMRTFPLMPPVAITQADIRELQLAKGAIAAGIRLLLEQTGTKIEQIDRIHLAGAFGNYINRRNARRIGLYHFDPDQVHPAGNTALLGAKLALFADPQEDGSYADLRQRVHHVSLSADLRFQEIYAEEMGFPAS